MKRETSRNYINSNFTKVNNQLYVSYEDKVVLKLSHILEIEPALLSAQKDNIDFFTFFTQKEEIDIDITFFFYFGANRDNGFLCFHCPSLIKNKTNILAVLDSIFSQNTHFNRDAIVKAIILDILTNMSSSLSAYKCRVVKSPSEIYFEFSNDLKNNIQN
ncbi:hypothetical protein GGR21_003568 [Dysgonomonas hofstadii]|uniref:Uncharacterized protein n=1 Tax=Dysgonomonas hofstadii TaxID=637886 RepID=A0A840CNH7_9BACT|nr:hypothetical protein [Dysgonomonas hofstadii]MBB4037647.1 hypothetical protein [Dysgonomonas hofstadii]